MQRQEYKTSLKASRERVWKILWGEDTYPVWTSVFSEGSRVVSDWKEGGKILFLNENNEGMVSRISHKRDNHLMEFEHIGMVDKDGREDLESEQVKSWAGAKEIYELYSKDDHTELIIKLDADEEHKDYFKETWPKAFEKLKVLAEE